MSERDELADVFTGHTVGFGGFPKKLMRGHAQEIAELILAAGYVKPRQVTTAEELDALPNGSVVLLLDRGYVYERTNDESSFPEDDWASPLHYVFDYDWLPATVLWEPQP